MSGGGGGGGEAGTVRPPQDFNPGLCDFAKKKVAKVWSEAACL